MPDDLYERDIVAWAEEHAELLRRLSLGERLNDVVDWPHLIEEVRDLGLSELRACESLLRQALVHLVKLRIDPGRADLHWRGEIVGFLADAQARYAPSMRQRLDLDALYRRAVRQVRAEYPQANLPPAPPSCPLTLDDLLSDDLSIDQLLARLAGAA